jgi:3-methylfumaryl-CoA hydratase
VTRNAHRIHYDKDYAQTEGHPDLLVHGPLQGAFLVQLVTDWIGKSGILKRISYQNRARAFVGDTLTCKGRVTRKYVHGDEHRVDCEIWVERQTGEVSSPGTATVALPVKG